MNIKNLNSNKSVSLILQAQEYMRQKAEREEAREKELAAQRMAKEREIARLRSLQQRQQDLQVCQIV